MQQEKISDALSLLTVSPNYSQELLSLGIEPKSLIFWNFKDGDSWNVEALPFVEYEAGEMLPAWTKEEIDCMIPPEYSKPDIIEASKMTRGEIPDQGQLELRGIKREDYVPDFFVTYYPTEKFNTSKGADASAALLIFALKNNIPGVTAKQCNNRYKIIYLTPKK